LPPAVLDAPVRSSFETLRKTLFHLLDAEILWLERLRGIKTEGWPSERMLPEQVFSEMRKSADAWIAFAAQQDAAGWLKQCAYKSIKGDPFETSVGDIALHCMNHATFHRGQIVTMLRELQAVESIPKTDYIQYCREND
jgi:uncharacterized damage-inducible protein DinB